MFQKTKFFCRALIIFGVASFCFSCSKTNTTPAKVDPELTLVDKISVINGEIITVTGKNFAKNYNGASQIVANNISDPSQQVYLSILSRTASEIVAVMRGSGSGAISSYQLGYNNKPDAGIPQVAVYGSSLHVNITAPASGQFFVSSTFTLSNVSKGAAASFGVKNGTTNAADYTVKLVGYDYESGLSTEYAATVTGVTANGYGGSMDQVNFTVPNVPSNQYSVKITYSGKTLVAGWNSIFLVN